MWIFLFFLFLLFLLLRIQKPVTTVPQSKQPTPQFQLTCAPPSGDTFPSNVPAIATGSPEVFSALRPSSVALQQSEVTHLLPVDAPPPFSLMSKTVPAAATPNVPAPVAATPNVPAPSQAWLSSRRRFQRNYY
jgi:hypothetical protein